MLWVQLADNNIGQQSPASDMKRQVGKNAVFCIYLIQNIFRRKNNLVISLFNVQTCQTELLQIKKKLKIQHIQNKVYGKSHYIVKQTFTKHIILVCTTHKKFTITHTTRSDFFGKIQEIWKAPNVVCITQYKTGWQPTTAARPGWSWSRRASATAPGCACRTWAPRSRTCPAAPPDGSAPPGGTPPGSGATSGTAVRV